jgi:hypothetical protein
LGFVYTANTSNLERDPNPSRNTYLQTVQHIQRGIVHTNREKAKIHRCRIPMFQVALTVVRARLDHHTTTNLVRETSTAFELQVPVDQREAMEKLLDKVFLDSTAMRRQSWTQQCHVPSECQRLF